MSLRLLLATLVGCTIFTGLFADSDSQSLCTIVQSASEYNRKMVRLRGIFAIGGEEAVLYDPACWKVMNDAGVAVTSKYKNNRTLDRLLKHDRRAWVIVEGIFYGPEPVQVDPKLPQAIKDSLKGTMTHYGHLGAFSNMIEVTKIIKVEAVPPNTPTPWGR
jgi:hypothetical protein